MKWSSVSHMLIRIPSFCHFNYSISFYKINPNTNHLHGTLEAETKPLFETKNRPASSGESFNDVADVLSALDEVQRLAIT